MKAKIIRARDYRHTCGRLLFRGRLSPGTRIEIRCPKCGRIHIIEVLDTSVPIQLSQPLELVSEIVSESQSN